MKQITQLHNIIELQKENNKLIFNEGEMGKAISIAKAMLQEGDPVEKIVRITGLSIKQVQQLRVSD